MKVYYNDNEPFVCAWARELIANGLVADGFVDERSIVDVRAEDLVGFTRCHFFSGICGWECALQFAGWPDDGRVLWTASCPCQPFSSAGKGLGLADERHLWPTLFDLVRECKPATLLGEQVSSAAGYRWLDGVFADLEGAGYACAAADLPAACAGAPHVRQRLFWAARRLADAQCSGGGYGSRNLGASPRPQGDGRDQPPSATIDGGATGRLADAAIRGPQGSDDGVGNDPSQGRDWRGEFARASNFAGGLGNAIGARLEGRGASLRGGFIDRGSGGPPAKAGGSGGVADALHAERWQERPADGAGPGGRVPPPGGGSQGGFWDAFDLIPCRDGKVRRVESGTFPLAHGIRRDLGPVRARLDGMGFGPKEVRRILRRPRSLLAMAGQNRTGRLRGYGNAIVPEVTATFIRAFLEAEHGDPQAD